MTAGLLTEKQRSELEQRGFVVVPDMADVETIGALSQALKDIGDGCPSVRRRGGIYGIRNLMDVVPAVQDFAGSEAVCVPVRAILGPGAFAVRGTLFDKTAETNWNVVWHQDLSIAVRGRREVPGFGPWSEKAGVTHVQPPATILERMLTVRFHLDPCGEENGPLCVLPGSHRHGRFDAKAIQEWRWGQQATVCTVPAGGALLMRPLLLHASSDAQTPGHRRVIHLDFAAEDLPSGLQWHAQSHASAEIRVQSPRTVE